MGASAYKMLEGVMDILLEDTFFFSSCCFFFESTEFPLYWKDCDKDWVRAISERSKWRDESAI